MKEYTHEIWTSKHIPSEGGGHCLLLCGVIKTHILVIMKIMDSPTTGMVHIMEKKMVPGKCLVMMCKEKDNFFFVKRKQDMVFFSYEIALEKLLYGHCNYF